MSGSVVVILASCLCFQWLYVFLMSFRMFVGGGFPAGGGEGGGGGSALHFSGFFRVASLGVVILLIYGWDWVVPVLSPLGFVLHFVSM